MARQRHLEKSAYDVALERLQQQAQTLESLGIHNPALNTSTLQKWMWEWHLKLRERIKEEIKVISEDEGNKQSRIKQGRPLARGETLAPYLNLVNPERLSLITIMEIMRLQGSSGLSDGMKTTRALISVGKAVEQEYKAQMVKKHNIYKEPPPLEEPLRAVSADNAVEGEPSGVDWYSQFGYQNLKEKRLSVSNELDGEEHSIGWSQVTRSRIGGILVDCLMEVAEVERTAKLDNGEVVYVVPLV
jgi:DNA-directed RNA polymerase